MKPASAGGWRASDLSRPPLLLSLIHLPPPISTIEYSRPLTAANSYRSFRQPQPSPKVQQLKAIQSRSGRVVSSSLLLTPHMDDDLLESSRSAPLLHSRLVHSRESLTERRTVPFYRLAVEFNKGVKLRQLVKGRVGLRDLLYATAGARPRYRPN